MIITVDGLKLSQDSESYEGPEKLGVKRLFVMSSRLRKPRCVRYFHMCRSLVWPIQSSQIKYKFI